MGLFERDNQTAVSDLGRVAAYLLPGVLYQF